MSRSPCEVLVADTAREGTLALMGPQVARELIRAAEAPVAALPRAQERAFTAVSPRVVLEMRSFLVHESASGEFTWVRLLWGLG